MACRREGWNGAMGIRRSMSISITWTRLTQPTGPTVRLASSADPARRHRAGGSAHPPICASRRAASLCAASRAGRPHDPGLFYISPTTSSSTWRRASRSSGKPCCSAPLIAATFSRSSLGGAISRSLNRWAQISRSSSCQGCARIPALGRELPRCGSRPPRASVAARYRPDHRAQRH
jgi:hypothetical protein